jgi:phosphatidate cytidylyltransferase
MSDLVTRTLTAIVLVLLALATLVAGGDFFAFFVAAAVACIYYEWWQLVRGQGAGWKIAGFFYALAPALALLWLRERPDGVALVLWVFVVTWAVDTGGYFVGRRFGRHPLAPAVSPKKTWEGLYGGVAAATLFGGLLTLLARLDLTLLLLAPILAVAAQIGDLFESWLKRRAGVKDSGSWLPGHGGLFDRLDGMIPVAVLLCLAELGGQV